MPVNELKSAAAIATYLEELRRRGTVSIALDLEGEFNLHCYGEHLCLIQIFDGQDEIVIDPFNFKDGQAFRALFEDPQLDKIMYDCNSDGVLLDNCYGIKLAGVTDLRPAVTLLGFEKQGLSSVLEVELALEPINKKKFQQYNWMRRPIEPSALDYAMSDVRHLFRLKDSLFAKLAERELFAEYTALNAAQMSRKREAKPKHAKVKGYDRLRKPQQEVFSQLYAARDQHARRLNRPPHFVFANNELMQLCRVTEPSLELIAQGMSPRLDARTRSQLEAELRAILNIA